MGRGKCYYVLLVKNCIREPFFRMLYDTVIHLSCIFPFRSARTPDALRIKHLATNNARLSEFTTGHPR